MANENKRKPDFNIYINVGTDEKRITQKIGAAWKHSTGEGLSISLFALPIDGKAVAFPYNEDSDKDKKKAT